jgi:hypothetical protein
MFALSSTTSRVLRTFFKEGFYKGEAVKMNVPGSMILITGLALAATIAAMMTPRRPPRSISKPNGWDTNAVILQAALIFLPIVLMIIVGLAMLARG